MSQFFYNEIPLDGGALEKVRNEFSASMRVSGEFDESFYDSLVKSYKEEAMEKLVELDKRIEYALRFLIDRPIKGKITKNKLDKRGITIGRIYEDFSTTTLSVRYILIQGDKLIPLRHYGEREKHFNKWLEKNKGL